MFGFLESLYSNVLVEYSFQMIQKRFTEDEYFLREQIYCQHHNELTEGRMFCQRHELPISLPIANLFMQWVEENTIEN